MAKRRPDIQLTKDNFDQEDRDDGDAPEYTGPMKVAAEEVLKTRTIVKAKRRVTGGGLGGGEDASNGLFSGLKSSFGNTSFGGAGGKSTPFGKFSFGGTAPASTTASSSSTSTSAFTLPNSFSSTSSSTTTSSAFLTKPSLFSGFSSSTASSTASSSSSTFAVPNSKITSSSLISSAALTSSKPLGSSQFSNTNGGGTMLASSIKPVGKATPVEEKQANSPQPTQGGDLARLNKEFFEHLKKYIEKSPTTPYDFSTICQEYINHCKNLQCQNDPVSSSASAKVELQTSAPAIKTEGIVNSNVSKAPFTFGLKAETSKLNEEKSAVASSFGETEKKTTSPVATSSAATPVGPPKASGLFKFGDIKGSDLTANAGGFKLPTNTPFSFGGGLDASSGSSSSTPAAPASFGWPKTSIATSSSSSTSLAPTLFDEKKTISFGAGAFATSTPLPKFGSFQATAAAAGVSGSTTFKLPTWTTTSTTTTSTTTTETASDGNEADGGGDGAGEGAEEDAPPKVASVEHNEADAVYRKKCRLYYQKDGNFVDKGLGFLYIKKSETGSRAQLLVRSDTTTGNILLNIALVESLPVVKAEKGKGVMLTCIPNPPIEPPAKKTGDGEAANGNLTEEASKKTVTYLLRVKIADSEELYDTICRYKAEKS